MASTTEPNHRHPINKISRFIQTATSSLSSLIPFPKPPAPALPSSPISSTTPSVPPSRICVPLLFPDSTVQLLPLHPPSPFESTQSDSLSSGPSSSASASASASYSALGGGFPSSVRISRLSSAEKGGPAFVGQVFSMCDLSGTGLMAVSKHFDIPFISKSTPEWIKKIFASVTESERDGPVFRFFMDLGDAVSYVRQLNIPSGVVGACRLDLAYDHFKEKPHLFQFVPNEKQVKEANKLLKIMPHDNGRRKRVDGVPVFSAQNLDIAIATTDGIKWYTPYFFDKNMLDNILEESADQHFHAMIKTRNLRRQREVTDDNVAAEMIEETKESVEELPEVLDAMMDTVLDEGIPMSAISKAAEILLLHAVDNVLLGNRWLRKATGIQPKFPYMVDSFEERSVASLLRASKSSSSEANSEVENSKYLLHHDTSELTSKDSVQAEQGQRLRFGFPFGDWSRHPFSNQPNHNQPDKRVESRAGEYKKQEPQHSPLLPKITMVGISTAEAGQVSKASLKKTMEDLTRELEQKDQGNADGPTSAESKWEDRDPLFVANVGDYFSGASKKGSARWVRREFD